MADDVIVDEMEKQEEQGRRGMRRLFLEAALIAFANCIFAPLVAAVLSRNPLVIFWILVPRVALGILLVSYGPAWVWLFLGNRFGWPPGITRICALVTATAIGCYVGLVVMPNYVKF